MEAVQLYESVPNFSEGRRPEVIAAIARAASTAFVLDTDPERDHNRTVITLAGTPAKLLEDLMAMVRVAVELIDVRLHVGVHPRVGAADVIPIVPLHRGSLATSRDLVRNLGERIWNELRVPVYFYGYSEHKTLADIRAGRASPDLGGPGPHPTAGAVCVGARQKLVAFNVILPNTDLAAARALARSLRESSGGIRGVQALAFGLPGDRVQLSMNLFRLEETTPSTVISELNRRSIAHGPQELVGLCPASVANEAGSGRLLEARMAAAAAFEGALRCEHRAGEEHARLAVRLRSESEGLARLGIDQADVLAGAERTAALAPVLAAAGMLDGDLRILLTVAARGLREAIDAQTLERYSARVAALDRRLDSLGDD